MGAVPSVGKLRGGPSLVNPAISFLDSAAITGSTSTSTFTDRAAGAAAENRWLLACISIGHSSAAANPTSVHIGGVLAELVDAYSPAGKPRSRMLVYMANVPTGTTATVVIVWGSGYERCGLVLIRYIGNRPSAVNIVKNFFSGTADVSQAVVVPDDGVGFAMVGNTDGDSNYHAFTWSGTGVTEVADRTTGGSNTISVGFITQSTTVSVVSSADGGTEFLFIGLEPS